MSSMHFAVTCSLAQLNFWESEAIKHIVSNGGIQLICFINSKDTDYSYGKRNPFVKFYDRYLVKSKLLQKVSIVKEFPDIKIINISQNCNKTTSFPEVDFIICFNDSISFLAEHIKPKYGYWFFRKDYSNNNLSSTSFQSVFEKQNTALIKMIIYDIQTNKNFVYREARLKTSLHSVRNTTDTLYKCCSSWISETMGEISDNLFSFQHKKEISISISNEKIRLNLFLLFLFILKILVRRFRKIYQDLFIAERWNIGFTELKKENLLTIKRIPALKWLKASRNGNFYADPFIAQINNRMILFFENFISSKNKGIISAMEINNENKIIVSLELDNHLSYPFLFFYENNWWCIPETHQLNEIALYKVNSNTFELIKEKVLIENFDGIDNTVIFYNNRWWMFSTHKHSKGAGTHLIIHHTENLFGKWKPHKRNPVKIDICSSRPAGKPFIINNILYRPAQDSSVSYGGRLTINMVLHISEDYFEEIIINSIEPNLYSVHSKGIHTICIENSIAIIDGKHYVFTLNKIRKLLGS